MDSESKFLLHVLALVATALSARLYPEQTFDLLWAVLAVAVAAWATRKRA